MVLVQPDEGYVAAGVLDYTAMAVVALANAFLLALSVFIHFHRKYPPLRTRPPIFLHVGTLGSLLMSYGVLVMHGMPIRFAPVCMEHAFFGLGYGLLMASSFVRFYRYYRVFVTRTADMWPVPAQIVATLAPYLPAPVAAFATSTYVPGVDMCQEQVPGMMVLYAVTHLLGFIAGLVVVARLRRAKARFNEFRRAAMPVHLIGLLLPIAFLAAHYVLFDGAVFVGAPSRQLGRVAAAALAVTTALIMTLPFYMPIAWKCYRRNENYLYSYTYGFRSVPHASVLSMDLGMQLYNQQVLEKVKQFAGERHAGENIEFYEAVLRREATEDYFERQAISIEIIDRFITPGAEQEINIEDNIRKAIMIGDINRWEIFDDAKRAVLQLIKSDLETEFKDTEGYRELVDMIAREDVELELLAKAGMSPVAHPLHERYAKSMSSASLHKSSSLDAQELGKISIDSARHRNSGGRFAGSSLELQQAQDVRV